MAESYIHLTPTEQIPDVWQVKNTTSGAAFKFRIYPLTQMSLRQLYAPMTDFFSLNLILNKLSPETLRILQETPILSTLFVKLTWLSIIPFKLMLQEMLTQKTKMRNLNSIATRKDSLS
jgi:hypothetical protein